MPENIRYSVPLTAEEWKMVLQLLNIANTNPVMEHSVQYFRRYYNSIVEKIQNGAMLGNVEASTPAESENLAYAKHVYQEIRTRYDRHQYDNISAHQVNLAILGAIIDLLEK